MYDRLKGHARRQIPAVGRILEALGRCDLPRPVVVDVIRRKLSAIRAARKVPDFESIVVLVRRSIEELGAGRLQSIINGTGILIHTNFGRAPLANQAIRALKEIGSGYSNLEYHLTTGARGQRGGYIENALALLCKAEAATVVNNCAAALVLIVRHFVRGKLDGFKPANSRGSKSEVIISRGELVQIGGGFRISEIIEATGAKLREVGATNKTTVDDYADAIGQNTAMILKVQRSNFFMSGFVESPSSNEISELARKKRIPFVEDLGSGAVAATEEFGITEYEPTPADVLNSGVDLVCFSGDKLFGGPQAGIIAGKRRFIGVLKREPLFRALRCDKLCLAALQATVDLHLNQQPGIIPTLGLLQISEDELRARATSICDQLSQQSCNLQVAVGSSVAKVGGGTLPKSKMPSVTIEIVPGNCSPLELASRLRSATPPVIGYLANDCFKLDVRTIFPEQDDLVVAAIRAACIK
jgi:L-seryl-tRNA(Ser) seleniumtransferase